MSFRQLAIINGGRPLTQYGIRKREVGNFITIFEGKFTKRLNKPDSVVSPEDTKKWLLDNGAVSRINKVGKTVYEVYHDSLTGKLVSLKVTSSEAYGKQWQFGFQDTKDIYLLQLPYSNSYAKNILKMLPNADLKLEMRVTPMVKVVEGKNKTSVFINQNGQALKHAWKKDSPDFPKGNTVIVKGVSVWDDTDQMVFLEKMVNDTIIPKLGGAVVTSSTAPVAKDSLDTAVEELQAGAVDPDSIPF